MLRIWRLEGVGLGEVRFGGDGECQPGNTFHRKVGLVTERTYGCCVRTSKGGV